MKIILSLMMIVLPLASATSNPVEVKDFFKVSQTHCTAWKTKKRIALVKIVKPVGMNCEITAKLELVDEKNKKYQLVVDSPLDGFDSGEKDRDLEVKKILGYEKRANITFVSEPKSEAELNEVIGANSDGNTTLSGKLLWADQSKDVVFNYSVGATDEKVEVLVAFDSKFTFFGIEPPSVVGGLIAKVYDELSLISKLDLAKIQDADGVIEKIIVKIKKEK